MDRAQPGRFGPTRCGPVYTRSVLILLLTTMAGGFAAERPAGKRYRSVAAGARRAAGAGAQQQMRVASC